MRRVLLGAAVLVLIGVGVWAFRGSGTSGSPAAPVSDVRASFATHQSPGPAGSAVPPVRTRRRADAAERERYRRAIAAAVAAKPRRTPPPTPVRSHAEGETRRSPQAEDFGADPQLEAMFGAIRADLIPLADECLELARERQPDLRGVFDVRFDVIGDDDIGGLVETFELGDDNDINDPDLIECVRETTLSTLFPPPEGTDRQELRLAIEIDPDT